MAKRPSIVTWRFGVRFSSRSSAGSEGSHLENTSHELGAIRLHRKSGLEPFRVGERSTEFNLLDFWQWSGSDLVDNTSRGILAEYIVAKALGIDVQRVREGWASWDLETDDGLRIEVKSAAFVQSWGQRSLSTVQFVIPKRRAFDADNGIMDSTPQRHAHVYVFALLAHKDKLSIDPLDLDQWQFYALPTQALNDRQRSQHSITLRSLESLAGPPIDFAHLAEVVQAIRAIDNDLAG
jgi:hypothetical protein